MCKKPFPLNMSVADFVLTAQKQVYFELYPGEKCGVSEKLQTPEKKLAAGSDLHAYALCFSVHVVFCSLIAHLPAALLPACTGVFSPLCSIPSSSSQWTKPRFTQFYQTPSKLCLRFFKNISLTKVNLKISLPWILLKQ